MGVQSLVLTMTLFFIWFPMWGSMLTGPRAGVEEEDYYMKVRPAGRAVMQLLSRRKGCPLVVCMARS